MNSKNSACFFWISLNSFVFIISVRRPKSGRIEIKLDKKFRDTFPPGLVSDTRCTRCTLCLSADSSSGITGTPIPELKTYTSTLQCWGCFAHRLPAKSQMPWEFWTIINRIKFNVNFAKIFLRKIIEGTFFFLRLHALIFTFSSHTEYVKRESIVIAWVKKKKNSLLLMNVHILYVL